MKELTPQLVHSREAFVNDLIAGVIVAIIALALVILFQASYNMNG